MNKRPIGIFDSGVGGLTVFKEIRKKFPFEDIIYFGDTARVPYGPKSENTVIEYSIQNARFLMQQGAKIIVIACNTSSAVALKKLQKTLNIPIVGVIQPGAIAANYASQNGKIGVIGTEGTIKSEAYKKAIKMLNKQTEIFSEACPLFVPLAEEGWINSTITKSVADFYLNPLLQNEIDTLVLGCTHYPILKNIIQQTVGKSVKLVDSAISVALELQNILPNPEVNVSGKNSFFVSDNEDKFRKIAQNILNKSLEQLTKVKLGESWYLS
ncbi:MAG: glutamate racemase [Candidatus Cloacimonetes bacterium]|nr:glutamate racemase [Candidatus Cloacimonadota bacterium]